MNFLSNCSPGVILVMGLLTFCSILKVMSSYNSRINVILVVSSMFFINLGSMILICGENGLEYNLKTSAYHCFIGICCSYLSVFFVEKFKERG